MEAAVEAAMRAAPPPEKHVQHLQSAMAPAAHSLCLSTPSLRCLHANGPGRLIQADVKGMNGGPILFTPASSYLL